MNTADSSSGQRVPPFFSLRTGRGQYVVKSPASNGLEVADDRDGAVLFQMPSVSAASDTAVLLQTLGGGMQLRAEPSASVVLHDGPPEQSPFLRVAMTDGIALGTLDQRYWLSVAGDGKLVFAELSTPSESETFATSQEYLRQHGCCGPSSSAPSKALWNDEGHRSIVRQAIICLNDPHSKTAESAQFIKMLNLQNEDDLFRGLHEADYSWELMDHLTFTSHFYDPDTEENYWALTNLSGDPGVTALQRGSSMFNDSVRAYRHESGVISADTPFELLGLALHYFTDLTQPMHAANIAEVFGDHPHWPLDDERHSRFEKYADSLATRHEMFKDYPQLTVEEMSLEGITCIEDLYRQVAKGSKKVWLEYVKPIYERKRYLEAWGDEAYEAVRQSTWMAPVAVAKFLLYWTRQINSPQHGAVVDSTDQGKGL